MATVETAIEAIRAEGTGTTGSRIANGTFATQLTTGMNPYAVAVDRLAGRKLVPSPALRPPAGSPVRFGTAGPLAVPRGDDRRDEARRFARLLASEIKLYNEGAVREGREHGNLYFRLREDIERGRRLYEERVPAEVRGNGDYYYEELVDVLAGGRPEAMGLR